jgi:hypothetical protein
MLATDQEIQQKRSRDALQFASVMQSLGSSHKEISSNTYLGARLRKTLDSLSKKKRAIIVLAVAWIAYVIYRTSGEHELVGVSLERWSDDAFLQNVLLPPLAIAGVIWLYKWITSGK